MPWRPQTNNGSEFVNKVLDRWVYEYGITMNFLRPGRHADNPFIESFLGSFRDGT